MNCSEDQETEVKEPEMSEKKVFYHRMANSRKKYLSVPEGGIAEGDLVKAWGKLYMFHPGSVFTLLMVRPMMWFFWLLWPFWKYFALPYSRLLRLAKARGIPILLEPKNISINDLEELPHTLEHLDTYDLNLARAVKKKFDCKVSIHLLWCSRNGGLVVRSHKGLFRWFTWDELQDIDIITPTYIWSNGWMNPEFWKHVKENWGKIMYLGGGCKGWFYRHFAYRFNKAVDYTDGWYLR